jgi:CBS domain-containing protein
VSAADIEPLAASPFHDVGRLFSGDTHVETVTPDAKLTDVLERMVTHGYSQLPVVEANEVRGVISLWSVARHLTSSPNSGIREVTVEDVMDEPLPSISVTDSLEALIRLLKEHEAVVVAASQGVQAIATTWDVLYYFYQVAHPYVLLSEIELAVRSVIQRSVTGEQLRLCVERALKRSYEERQQRVPSELDDMSFDDYRALIVTKKNFELFESVLGSNRVLIDNKLTLMRETRNRIFHFRGAGTTRDHENLVWVRNWLLEKLRKASRRNRATG